MKNILLLIGFLILFVSCDPAVRYSKSIRNNTNYDIWLIRNDSGQVSTSNINDSFLLLNNSEFILIGFSEKAATPEQFITCPYYPGISDTISTRIEGNDTLNLSYVIDPNANWAFSVLKTGSYGESECKLTINQGDIQ